MRNKAFKQNPPSARPDNIGLEEEGDLLSRLNAEWADAQTKSSAWPERSDERDLANWARIAETFDDDHSLAQACPELVERIRQLVNPSSTVLDLGAGTGEFSFPLADCGCLVTAVDYSPAMLERLRSKITDQNHDKVLPRLCRWEEIVTEPHDVVLVVNALYRTIDAAAALNRLETLATRKVIVASFDGQSPHYGNLLRNALGLPPYQSPPGMALLEALLKARGRDPHKERFSFHKVSRFGNIVEAVREMGRGVAEEALSKASDEMSHWLSQEDGNYVLRYEQRVTLLHWHPGKERLE